MSGFPSDWYKSNPVAGPKIIEKKKKFIFSGFTPRRSRWRGNRGSCFCRGSMLTFYQDQDWFRAVLRTAAENLDCWLTG